MPLSPLASRFPLRECLPIAVRIVGEGEEQSRLEGREETLDYLFAPGIRQEHSFLIWTRLLIRDAGPSHRAGQDFYLQIT